MGDQSVAWKIRLTVVWGFTAVKVCLAAPLYRPSLGPLDTSSPPSEAELVAAGQLGGPLHATRTCVDTPQGRAMNLDFGRAIELWNRHDFTNAVTLFRQHTAQYPESPWRDESDLHCSCDAVYLGRWPDADALLSGILERQAEATEEPNVMMRSKARLRLGTLRVAENDLEGAGQLFAQLRKESPDWRHRTYAEHWIHRIARMKRDELQLRACGTRALAVVQERLGNPGQATALRALRAERVSGQSASWLADTASAHGLKLQPRIIADPADLARVAPPAVVHIAPTGIGRAGHYWVFVGVSNELLEFLDPTSGRPYRLTARDLAAQWSGVVLALPDAAKVGRLATAEDLKTIEGGCCGTPIPESQLGKQDPQLSTRSPGDKNPCGFPVWDVNMANMNVLLWDIPFWYTPPVGPAVSLQLTYNSQSAIAYYEPFGAKWSSGWTSYLVMDTAGNATVFMPDGRRNTYTRFNDVFTPLPSNHNELRRIAGVASDGSEDRYELTLVDGTVMTYRQPTPNTNRQFFLVEQRDSDNLSLTYVYTANGLLSAVSDAQGRLTTLSYNANGKCTRVADPFGRHADFGYSELGELVTITDMGGYTANLTYDANLNVTSMGNETGTWKFRIEPSDGIGMDPSFFQYPAPGAQMWQNYRITATDPLGAAEEFFFFGGYDLMPDTGADGTGFTWHITPRHYIPWVSPEENNYFCKTPRTTYFFNVYVNDPQISDLVVEISRPLGGGEYYTYDDRRHVTSVSNRLGQVWRMSYNEKGMMTSEIDPAGTAVTYGYAANLADLVRVTTATGSISYAYDAKRHVTSICDPYSNRWNYAYNTYGQLTNAVDPEGRCATFIYDGTGRVTRLLRGGEQVASYGYDAMNRINARAGGDGSVWRWAYNALDAITQVTRPDGLTNVLEYSDCCPRLVTRAVDVLGREKRFTYDARRRLIATTGSNRERLEFAYDPDGHVNRLTDANRHSFMFAMDAAGRVTHQTNAVGAVIAVGYAADDRVIAYTNSRGQSVTWLRDAAGRVKEERHSGVLQNSFTYDPFSQITQASGPWGGKSFAYDRLGRMTSVTYPGNLAVGQQFSPAGLLAAVTYPNSFRVDYRYDGRGQPTNVTWTGGGWVALTYSAAGELIRERRSNGTTTEYAHNALGLVTNIWHQNAGGTLARIAIGRDVLGNVTARSGLPLEAFPVATNRMARYDAANRVVQWGGSDCLYDADGNLTNAAARGFAGVYDALNRLKGWTRGGVQTVCVYDDSGTRIRTVTGGVTNRYAFSPGSNLVADITGNATNFNIYLGKRLLARRADDGATVFYHADQIGNVLLLTDAAGQPARQYAYEPFGAITAQNGVFTNNPFTFVGAFGVVDDGSGLYWMRARHYDAALGRFLQSDPIGWAGGPNLYAYVRNKPMAANDPSGLVDDSGSELWIELELDDKFSPEDRMAFAKGIADFFLDTIVDKVIGKFFPAIPKIFLDIDPRGRTPCES